MTSPLSSLSLRAFQSREKKKKERQLDSPPIVIDVVVPSPSRLSSPLPPPSLFLPRHRLEKSRRRLHTNYERHMAEDEGEEVGRTEGRAEEDEEDEEKGHKSTFLTPSDAATALAHHDSLILSFRLPRRQPAPITTDGRREEGRKGGRKEGSHSTAPPSPSPSPEEPIPIRPTSLFYSLSLSSLKCVWPRPDNQAAVVLLPFRGQRGQRHYTSSVSAATGRRKAAREGRRAKRKREMASPSLSPTPSISPGVALFTSVKRGSAPHQLNRSLTPFPLSPPSKAPR